MWFQANMEYCCKTSKNFFERSTNNYSDQTGKVCLITFQLTLYYYIIKAEGCCNQVNKTAYNYDKTKRNNSLIEIMRIFR